MIRNSLLILTSFILFCFPNENFAQAPNLGVTSSFALFTAAGALNNVSGASYITGNIGSFDVQPSGFPGSGTVTGTIYNVSDPLLTQAKDDVASAYSQLLNLTCDSTIGTTLGNDQVLFPKVYCLGAASSLNGNLTLDGQGNSNALFIFKVDGALSTSINSNVILINSASLCNVYWQINGKFDLGNSSVFRGTLIANGAINLLESSSLLGRGLSTAGAISLHNNIATIGMQPTASIISANGATTFCAGGSIILSGNNGGIWNNAAAISSITVNTSSDCFVTNTTCCSSVTSNHISVIVNPSPTVTANATDTMVTAGDSVTLTGGGAASYLWTEGVFDGVGFVPLSTNTYQVTGTDVKNCSNTATKTVTVNLPLPIELLNFIAIPAGANIQLDWSTASEINNDYFTVQHSKDGISFEEVLRMHAIGNSHTVLHYSAIDYNPFEGTSYYRLKQTDFNGKFTCSNIVDIVFKKSVDLAIYPNPFSMHITVSINDASQINNCELRIVNILGAEMMNTTITNQLTTLETNNLPSGIYTYKVISNDKTIQSGKLISQQ